MRKCVGSLKELSALAAVLLLVWRLATCIGDAFSYAEHEISLSWRSGEATSSVRSLDLYYLRSPKDVASLMNQRPLSYLLKNQTSVASTRTFIPADSLSVLLRVIDRSGKPVSKDRLKSFSINGVEAVSHVGLATKKLANGECVTWYQMRLDPCAVNCDHTKVGGCSVAIALILIGLLYKRMRLGSMLRSYAWELLAMLVFCWLLTINISQPWGYSNDDNGTLFSGFARNHLDCGLGKTVAHDFYRMRVTGELKPYVHHPPFVTWTLATIFGLSGRCTPAMARLAMVGLSLLTGVIFFALTRLVFTGVVARLTSMFVYAVLPIAVFYGRMPNHQVPGNFFLLLGYMFTLLYFKKKESRWLGMACIAWIGVCFSSWHAAICALAFCCVVGLCYENKCNRRYLWWSVLALVVGVSVVGVHILIAKGHAGVGENMNKIACWTGGSKPYLDVCMDGISNAMRHGRASYAIVPWYAFWTTAIWNLIKIFRLQKINSFDVVIFASSLGTVVYAIVFPMAVRNHVYQAYYLLTPVALASGIFVERIWKWVAGTKIWRFYVILLALLMVTLYGSYTRQFDFNTKTGSGYADYATQTVQRFYETYW